MSLIALEIPDNQSELPGWLERQLVSLELASLVADLEAVHGNREPVGVPIDGVLGEYREAALEHGLSALPKERLRELLLHPRILLDLQELILVEGGAHWERLAREGLRSVVDRGWKRLDAFLTGRGGRSGFHGARVHSSQGRWGRYLSYVALVIAASVLVSVLVNRARAPRPTGEWGWNREALPQHVVSRGDYLKRLADEAQEWFRKRPSHADELARRIGEFRQGCSALILSKDKPLSTEDQQWLMKTCREWARKFDEYLARVEAGEEPMKIRALADETTNEIIQSLRERVGRT
jgi:hypothetical protein